MVGNRKRVPEEVGKGSNGMSHRTMAGAASPFKVYGD